MVFDAPRNGRAFFEALVADNLDLGRPEQLELIFGRKILPTTPGVFATRVVTRGVDASSTSATSTPAPRSTSRKAGRCGSRPWSTTRPTSACTAASSTCPNFSQGP